MKAQFLGEEHARVYPTTLCRELCKKGLTDWYAVWDAESREPCIRRVQTPHIQLKCIVKHSILGLGKRVNYAKTGEPILMICTSHEMFMLPI